MQILHSSSLGIHSTQAILLGDKQDFNGDLCSYVSVLYNTAHKRTCRSNRTFYELSTIVNFDINNFNVYPSRSSIY